MAVLQYGKIILELLAVILYSLGGTINLTSRAISLLTCLILAAVLFGMMYRKDWYAVLDDSMLIPNIFDADVATVLIEIFDVFYLAALGIGEHVRHIYKNHKLH